MKNYSSILAIVNHRNWLDDSPPLTLFDDLPFGLGFDLGIVLTEVESSRTSLASRTSSRTDFEVLGLEGQVLGLGLEASSPRKLACPRLEDSTIFRKVKILWSGFSWRSLEKFFFFFFFFFFFLEIA